MVSLGAFLGQPAGAASDVVNVDRLANVVRRNLAKAVQRTLAAYASVVEGSAGNSLHGQHGDSAHCQLRAADAVIL